MYEKLKGFFKANLLSIPFIYVYSIKNPKEYKSFNL